MLIQIPHLLMYFLIKFDYYFDKLLDFLIDYIKTKIFREKNKFIYSFCSLSFNFSQAKFSKALQKHKKYISSIELILPLTGIFFFSNFLTGSKK
jgi:hypothetical protein